MGERKKAFQQTWPFFVVNLKLYPIQLCRVLDSNHDMTLQILSDMLIIEQNSSVLQSHSKPTYCTLCYNVIDAFLLEGKYDSCKMLQESPPHCYGLC